MDIQEVGFFEEFSPDVINKIKQGCSEKTFDEGDTIFEKGASADFLYFLIHGSIDLFLKEKNMTLCNLSEPGEVFGWSSIVEKGIYTSTSICRSATSVFSIPKDKVDAIFNQHPNAAVEFYRRLGSIFSKRISKVFE